MRPTHDEPERHKFAKAGCSYEEFADRFGLSNSGAKMWMTKNGYRQVKRESDGRECLDPPSEKHAYYALYLAIIKELTIPKALKKIAS